MLLSPHDAHGALAALAAAGALATCTWTVRDGEAYLDGANPAFEALLGYSPGALAALQAEAPVSWRSLTRGTTGTPLDTALVEPGTYPGVGAEHTLCRSDGTAAVALITTIPGPGPGRLVSLAVDVTEQARLRRDAEQASEAKSRFIAVMSHELRSPLNVIHGQVELLREQVYGSLATPQAQALERVHRAERKLKGVIDEVLTFSRLEMGQVSYDIRAFPIEPMLEEIAEAVTSQCAAKRQSVELDLPEGGAQILADEEKLRTALLAIVSNASKFTPPEGRIVIDTASRLEVPAFLFIRVTDTGDGVPGDHFESIFSPFAQVDERSARRAEGLGLGLTIARDLVRGMGGDVRVRSRPGQGSTFTVAVRRAGE